MVNDFREYAGVIEENDYIRHWLYIRKEKKPYGWRYIYSDEYKKLYNDTVQYKRMKADQNMRNSHKKIGNGTYIDYEDHFPFESDGKHQIGATSKVRSKDGSYHTIRTESDVGDDTITYKDLIEQYKRNKKIKRDTKKRISKQKLENFLEKTFGYVPMDKLKKRIKAESDSRDLMLRFKKKQAEEKEAKKRYATDKRWRNTDSITADKKFKNMEKKMNTQYNKNHKNITIGNNTWYVNGKKINTPFGTSGYVKEVSNPKPEGKFNPLAGITGGSTAYIKELTEKEKKKHSSVNQNKARRK